MPDDGAEFDKSCQVEYLQRSRAFRLRLSKLRGLAQGSLVRPHALSSRQPEDRRACRGDALASAVVATLQGLALGGRRADGGPGSARTSDIGLDTGWGVVVSLKGSPHDGLAGKMAGRREGDLVRFFEN